MNFTDIAVPEVVPRDGFDRPMVVPSQGGKPVPYARTTTYIDCIEDKSSLSTWAKRSVLVGAARRADLIEATREITGASNINGLDQGQKKELDALAEQALASSGANDKREKGTELHGYSELIDQGLPLPEGLPELDLLDMAAYAIATHGMSFSHIEEFVVCDPLHVGGTPDRVCNVDPEAWGDYSFPPGASPLDSFIFDLKTGTMEYGGLKMAAQLAIYSRAGFYDFRKFPAPLRRLEGAKANSKEWDQWKGTEFEADQAQAARRPLPPVNQDWGIILNLPAGTATAELYWVDLKVGWRAAELATSIREMRSLSGKATVSFSKYASNIASAAERAIKAAEKEAARAARAAARAAKKEAAAQEYGRSDTDVVCNADQDNNEGGSPE